MAELKDDIEKYLRGQLTPLEMHVLEKKALNDPFLFEALEGASSVRGEDFLADVIELKHRLAEQKTKKSPFVIPLRIAASITLLAIASYGIYLFTKTDENLSLADKKPAGKPEVSATKDGSDSLLASAREKPTENLLSLGPAVAPSSTPEREKAQPISKPIQPLDLAELRKANGATGEVMEETHNVAGLKQSEPVIPTASEIVATDDKLVDDPAKKDLANNKAKGMGKKERSSEPTVTGISPQVINGKITDAQNGNPIPGANILVQGTNLGTLSDSVGNYQMTTNARADNLVISSIGFETREVRVPGGQAQLDVQLPANGSQLSEVAVVGYSGNTTGPDSDDSIQLAEPADGRTNYNRYLENNLRYPAQALAKKIEGKVTLEFAVQPDGTLTDFRVVRGLEYGCNDEVIRLIKEGPGWKPSLQGGVSLKSTVRVRVKFNLPK